MKFIKGMPLICNINNRELNIWNSQIFTVDGFKCNNTKIILNNTDNTSEKIELDLNFVTSKSPERRHIKF